MADFTLKQTGEKLQALINEIEPLCASTATYVECTTAAYTAAKKINISGYEDGKPIRIAIKMAYACLVENPTLAINEGNPYPLVYNWNSISKHNTWKDGNTVDVLFDGYTFYAFSIAKEIFESSYEFNSFEKGTLNASNGSSINNDNALRTAGFITVVPGTYKLDFAWPKEVAWAYWLGYKDGVFVKRDVLGDTQNTQFAHLLVDDTFNQLKITTSASSAITDDELSNTKITLTTLTSGAVENAMVDLSDLNREFKRTIEELEENDAALEERVQNLELNGGGGTGSSGESSQVIEGMEIGNINAATGIPFNQNNALRTSDFIPVVPGTYKLDFAWPKDVAWTYWLGYKDGVFVKRDVVGDSQNVQFAQIKVDESFNQIKFTTFASSDFNVSEAASTKITLTAPVDMVIQGLVTQIGAIKNVFDYDDKTTLLSNVGFVSISGQISTSAAYRYTNPIQVQKGEVYYLNGDSSQSVAVVSMNDGSTIKTPLSVIQRGVNDGRTDFIFVADKTQYVVFSIYGDGAKLYKLKDGLLPLSVLVETPRYDLSKLLNARFISVYVPNLNTEENFLDMGDDPYIITNNHAYEFKAIFTDKDAYRRILFNADGTGLQVLIFDPVKKELKFSSWNSRFTLDTIIMGFVSRGPKTGDYYVVNHHDFAFPYIVNGYDAELQDVAKIANSANNLCDLAHPYIYHYFMTGFDADTLPTIPGQSLEDISIARRLGFKVIEANVHKTSDGQYAVIHGDGGKLGYLMEDNNGNLANDVVIANTTLSELQSNYRYRSKFPQYRTRIPSLEEFVSECKRQGLSIYVQYVDDPEMEIVRRVIGGHNFIQSFGIRKDGSYTAAYSNKDTLLQKAKESDSNFMPMMENILVESLIAESNLKSVIDEIHRMGKIVGYPASYATENVHQQTIEAGMDFSVVAYQVNDFSEGNLFSEVGENTDFSMFGTDGTQSNGVLSLQNGQHIEKILNKVYFLSKSSLHVRFKGTIKLTLGQHIQAEQFMSDGKTDMFFSTYYLEQIPSMRIESVGVTEIVSIALDISSC